MNPTEISMINVISLGNHVQRPASACDASVTPRISIATTKNPNQTNHFTVYGIRLCTADQLESSNSCLSIPSAESSFGFSKILLITLFTIVYAILPRTQPTKIIIKNDVMRTLLDAICSPSLVRVFTVGRMKGSNWLCPTVIV